MTTGSNGPSPIDKGATAVNKQSSSAASSFASNFNISQDEVAAYISGQGGGGTTAGGPSGVTTKTTYAPGAKTADINTIWRQYTGKDASKKQVNAIIAAINAAMKASPDKSTNTGGDFSTTTKVVGADPNEIIKQQALQDPNTPSYMAATTYYDAMMSAIRGPLGGGY